VPEPGRGPVFVVPHEFGFQSAIENYNGTWQAKVWARFRHSSLPDLQGRSRRYVTALRRHRADRIESAPRRRAFPERWRLNLPTRPRGRIISLRRTSATGTVEVLGRSFDVDPHWCIGWCEWRWTSMVTRSASTGFAGGSRRTSPS
jgi:hypothetical protein